MTHTASGAGPAVAPCTLSSPAGLNTPSTLQCNGSLYLLHAKLHLLILHHQVTDVFDRQVAKQPDVIASDLIKQMHVATSEIKSVGGVEWSHSTFIVGTGAGERRTSVPARNPYPSYKI